MSAYRIYPAASIALIAIYFRLPPGNGQTAWYDLIGAGAVVAILYGVWLHKPQPLWPWLAFAAGNAFFVLGDVAYALYDAPAPIPSAADVFYLGGYPLLAAGLLQVILSSGAGNRFAALADIAIVALAFGAVQWVYVMGPTVEAGEGAAESIVNGLYPAMDVLLLAACFGYFLSPAWRTPAFFLLVGGAAGVLFGDEIYLRSTTYASGDWIDTAWLLSYTLWGCAALHPSMRELSRPRQVAALRVNPVRIALLAAALLVTPVVLAVEYARGKSLELYEVAGLGAAISVLVVWRLTGILRAVERLSLRERSLRTELGEQNERLLEADRLKDEFVAMISHDLRTPLTSIMGYIELALDDIEPKLDDDRRGYLEVVSRSSARLLRLVDDLLFVARLQTGSLELTPTQLDLSALANQAADEARHQAELKGIELVFDGNGAVPVDADRGRIFQLLDNIVANAIKFTPSGGRVEIRVTRNGSAVLEVCDTGMGFSAEEATRIFERFFRTDEAVEGQVQGTGLGLFIARAITEAHGGTISAHPRDSGGAVFRIELPTAKEAGSE